MLRHFKHIVDGIRVPAGEAYTFVEGGNGELGFVVATDGTGRPYKAYCRSPSFVHLATSQQLGGTQDVGSSEQNGAGNVTWRQVSQGDGAATAVDVISSPGNAIHYTSAQNLQSFQRRTINGSNNQVGQASLGLAVAFYYLVASPTL